MWKRTVRVVDLELAGGQVLQLRREGDGPVVLARGFPDSLDGTRGLTGTVAIPPELVREVRDALAALAGEAGT